MALVMIDTAIYAERLREAGLDPRFADALNASTVEDHAPPRFAPRTEPSDDIWKQSVETRLSDLRSELIAFRAEMTAEFRNVRERQERDFRLTMGTLITAVLGLAALMAHGFHWIG